jgi:outer membrane protein
MRKITIIVLMLVATSVTYAQQSWTVDSCIAYAIAHSNDLGRARIEQRQSSYDEKTAKLDLLPTVYGQVSGQYAWGRNIDPETNTYNTITTFNNYYTLEASLDVFDGGQTLNAFKRAKNAREQSATAYQKAADDKAINVMTKFVDAVYNAKSVALAEEKLADSRALLHKTQRLFEMGEKSRPDVVQMESQVKEDEYNLLHQQNQARLTLLALKSEMHYPMADTLALAAAPQSVEAVQVNNINRCINPTVQLAEQKATDLKYAWLIERGNLLPKLTLGGGVQTSYYRNLTQGSAAASFGSQFHNNMGEYVYMTLSIPLFTPSRWRSARRAKSEWQKAVLDADDARRKLQDDIVQAEADRDGYGQEVAQMEAKVNSDSLAYHLSSRKYEEGMLSTFDLHTAAQTLLESRIKLLQTQLLYGLKQRLVEYYNGKPLW